MARRLFLSRDDKHSLPAVCCVAQHRAFARHIAASSHDDDNTSRASVSDGEFLSVRNHAPAASTPFCAIIARPSLAVGEKKVTFAHRDVRIITRRRRAIVSIVRIVTRRRAFAHHISRIVAQRRAFAHH
jgi:hypothetical protein